MDTFRAKDDKPTGISYDADVLLHVPRSTGEEGTSFERRKKKRFVRWIWGGRGGGQSERDSTMNYDQGVEGLASVDESGYYEMVEGKQEVIEAFTRAIAPFNFITSGIFGNHTESAGPGSSAH